LLLKTEIKHIIDLFFYNSTVPKVAENWNPEAARAELLEDLEKTKGCKVKPCKGKRDILVTDF